MQNHSGQGTAVRPLRPSRPGAAKAARGAVLVIDDEESVRRVAARLLRSQGFEAWEAHDGRDALDRFAGRAAALRLAVVDLTMPRLGGEDTVREWRRLRPDLPVILMSGLHEDEMDERFTGLAVSAFLQKPFTLNDFVATVQAVLNVDAP
jgi:two-component system cell cycle sensor histidine kinase/response regulator CckA